MMVGRRSESIYRGVALQTRGPTPDRVHGLPTERGENGLTSRAAQHLQMPFFESIPQNSPSPGHLGHRNLHRFQLASVALASALDLSAAQVWSV
jgi:hypothetical protein